MSGFDTPIPATLIVAWAVLLLLGLGWSWTRFHGAVSPLYQALLLALRAASAVAVLLLLLQPFWRATEPDAQGFRVAILADASQSMSVQDCGPDTARIDRVRQAVLKSDPDSVRTHLEQRYPVRCFMFSEKLQPLPDPAGADNKPVPLLPGRTALGDALRQCLEEFASVPLGAVLVVSDGNSNHGEAVTEVCKLYRRRAIPVSCIGTGGLGAHGDVRIRFADDTLSGVKGQPLQVQVEAENTLDREVPVTVELSAGNRVVDRREVRLAAGAGRQTVPFSLTPDRAGFQTLAARIAPVPGDTRRDTDVDYLGLNVEEPAVFRVLYLGAYLNWEYKFLKLLDEETEQLALATVLRTGRDTFYFDGLPEKAPTNGFPKDHAVFNAFDVLALDLRAVPLLPRESIQCIVDFVDHRGGGLLCFGPADGLPAEVADLLPVAPDATPLAPSGADVAMEASSALIFDKDPGGVLHTPRGLTLPASDPNWLARELKKGARPALTVRASGETVLAAQFFGSGRVAYAGQENTWRWRLGSEAGKDSHDAFWKALLVWLGSSSKPRLAIACAGTKAGVGEQVDLDVTVLGPDFRPAPDTRAACTITSPSGEREELRLDTCADAAGRCTGVFFPREAGEYAVAYRISLPEGDLNQEARFLARHRGVEADDTTYREDVLRDVSRITGGRFWQARDAAAVRDLPLSANIPMRTTYRYWTDSWLLWIFLAATLCTEWYCRRRIGLK
ncbi:MAG: hypothetical protein A3K18_11835 [Lentisphaerae bacterium RIFOXYA12_64_32]|nr:MAG: hypothetical protein A3K18_11835 [Lentisphaerae bacterium RIFOXYA12_64_32]